MPPPSPLAIATSSVQRLVKEESMYHKELVHQQTRVSKLEQDIANKNPDLDENAEYMLKQEKQAMDETKAVFQPLRKRIADAVAKLEEQIALSESGADEGSAEQLAKAKDTLTQGQEALKAGEE
ncbi:tubulin folding cofactor A [Gnomoniopsis sp. IMI 355080]|nr:tubulin folding cofactor A [Gnomoniopsis sp. IMI 355080]